MELFESYEKQYANVKLVKVQNNEAFWGNKKFALTLGIKAAKKRVFSIYRCGLLPSFKRLVVANFDSIYERKTIILGYGAYEKS